jgi:hypothetical protein
MSEVEREAPHNGGAPVMADRSRRHGFQGRGTWRRVAWFFWCGAARFSLVMTGLGLA